RGNQRTDVFAATDGGSCWSGRAQYGRTALRCRIVPGRPFRFGAQVSNARSGEEWVALARRLEDQGFSSLLMPDHFDDQLAPMPALAMAAEATSELRVGSLVLDNDYKHPVVLAKEAAT